MVGPQRAKKVKRRRSRATSTTMQSTLILSSRRKIGRLQNRQRMKGEKLTGKVIVINLVSNSIDIMRQFKSSSMSEEDFVKRNIQSIPKWDEQKLEKRLSNRQVQIQRLCDANERKQSQEMDELKMKHFLVHKWQIIRQKKQAYFAQLTNCIVRKSISICGQG